MEPSAENFQKKENKAPVVELYDLKLKVKQGEEADIKVGFKPNLEDGEIEIHIETIKGKTIQLHVGKKEKILNVKHRYEIKEGIPIEQQRLIYEGALLDEAFTIDAYEIQEGDTINMIQYVAGGCFLPEAPITLRDGSTKMIKDLKEGEIVITYNTKTSRLEANKMSSLSTFKSSYLCEINLGYKKVECTPSHPFWVPDEKEWKAVFPHPDSNMKALKPGDSLLDSEMKTIKIESIKVIPLQAPVDVFSMHVESTNCFFACGVLAHNMQLFVKTDSGAQAITINVEPNFTISRIKEIIKQENGLPPESQTLVFAGKILENQKTLSDYNIQKDSTLFLSQQGDKIAIPQTGFILKVQCEQGMFSLSATAHLLVKDLKKYISSLTGTKEDEFVLLYAGNLLLENEKTIGSYNIKNDCNIVFIPASKGGNCLRFMEIIEKEELKQLKDCLKNIWDQRLEDFLTETKAKVEEAKASNKASNTEALHAVCLWTSNIIHKQINEQLANSQKLSEWSPYLKLLMTGLKQLPFYGGKAYKAIETKVNIEDYPKGLKVNWKTISGLSKHKKIIDEFSNPNGTIFEVQVVSGRDVSEVTVSPGIEDVILLPYTCFEVVNVEENQGKPLKISLREISLPRAPKVLFWVDDEPHQNYNDAQKVEERLGISCVLCTNTKDALDVIGEYRWLLYFAKSDFRVVTDMVRYENGHPNYTAGVDLLQGLIQKYKYNFEVLIFCNDIERAKKSCEEKGLDEKSYFVANTKRTLFEFIKFAEVKKA